MQLYRVLPFYSSTRLSWSFQLRLPTHDQDCELDKFQNKTGFAWTLMWDFQRLFVAVDMDNKAKHPDVAINVKYITTVTACTGFSSKITLVMGSQGEWRLQFGVPGDFV